MNITKNTHSEANQIMIDCRKKGFLKNFNPRNVCFKNITNFKKIKIKCQQITKIPSKSNF